MKNLLFLLFLWPGIFGLFPAAPVWDFDAQLQAYFAAETEKIRKATETELMNISDWPAYRQQAREELQDMLGLFPWPGKTNLEATVTGRVEHEDFIVEKIHFQSMPGLYVTGNLYIPKHRAGAVPAIVYVCGHATIIKEGYNYGAKVHYQHHPAWFARHGYVCLILDTLQLGEVEGIHHGLYRYDRWWWLSRGYTPAGVEAWNGIRAIDYLVSRPEVDSARIGVTGRSGGGATSWWIAALDDRVKAAVPVAGITDMQDHVVEGCVEGHCDCMYMFNHHAWDYSKLAALVAPRPLLLSNTDRDPIFPIAGVFRIYQQVRPVYERLGAADQFALHTTAGPHQDVQELRIHAFRWFNRFLYERDDLIEKPAVKFFTPEQLRVFDELPSDAINDRIDSLFNPVASAVEEVLNENSFEEAKAHWYKVLQQQVFKSWPDRKGPPTLQALQSGKGASLTLTTYGLQTDAHTHLPVFRIQPRRKGQRKKSTRIVILDDANWTLWSKRLAAVFPEAELWKEVPKTIGPDRELIEALSEVGDLFLVSARGMGPAAFSGDEKKQVHIRRRFYLLGQSLNTMQTWDILQALRSIAAVKGRPGQAPLEAQADGLTAGLLLYASLFTDTRLSLRLTALPKSHVQGPYYLNILRYMDMPAAVLMAGEKHELKVSPGVARH